MKLIRSVTSILLLAAVPHTYALDLLQSNERERRWQPVAPPASTVQPPSRPAALTERQPVRRENRSIGEAPQGFTSPQTISIDRFNLHPDTLVEHQFEPVSTLTLQDAETSPATQPQSPAQSESTGEEPRQEQSLADAEPAPPEQPIGELIEGDMEQQEKVSALERPAITGPGAKLRIIEDNNRIIITQ